MELKFVIPNMAKSLGNLEFGGPAEVKRGDTRRNGTQTKVLYRRYKLFSDVQRADDIEVVIDGAAGQKQFAYMEPVKLKNPSVTAGRSWITFCTRKIWKRRKRERTVRFMRFSNGFFGENEATLGTLRFSAMRREVFEENADGTPSEVVKERTYDLKSDKQGRMIQVSVPASIPVRDFAYNAEVKLVNPMFGAIAHVTFGNSAEVDWYIKADDLVLKTPVQNGQPHKDVPADKKS